MNPLEQQTERIWAENHTASLDLWETPFGLEVTAHRGDADTTVTLDLDEVRTLRRALARAEKRMAAHDTAGHPG